MRPPRVGLRDRIDFLPMTFKSTCPALYSTPLLLVMSDCTPTLLVGTLQIANFSLMTAPGVTTSPCDPKAQANDGESTKCSPVTVTSDLPVSVTTVGVTDITRGISLYRKGTPGCV